MIRVKVGLRYNIGDEVYCDMTSFREALHGKKSLRTLGFKVGYDYDKVKILKAGIFVSDSKGVIYINTPVWYVCCLSYDNSFISLVSEADLFPIEIFEGCVDQGLLEDLDEKHIKQVLKLNTDKYLKDKLPAVTIQTLLKDTVKLNGLVEHYVKTRNNDLLLLNNFTEPTSVVIIYDEKGYFTTVYTLDVSCTKVDSSDTKVVKCQLREEESIKGGYICSKRVTTGKEALL